jgi:hypothetical protein
MLPKYLFGLLTRCKKILAVIGYAQKQSKKLEMSSGMPDCINTLEI